MHRTLHMKGTLGPSALTTLRHGVYDGKIAGLYDLEETLGRGHFAVVKLARHVFTGEKVAVKVIDKSKLDEVSKAHLFQEVRCMKLVQHPNVVRLYEVIDTATKLYLILELGDGGDLYDYIMRHDTGLSEAVAREYFRQIVRAITYCHQLHVVHRDLKPENVVFFQKLGVVKLTDFGFSNKFCPGQKLETSCGSLAYSAPEILLGDSYDAPAVDVWSLGVILYMLVCGQAPFQEANDSETLTMIMDCKYTVPVHVSKECKDLIARMLVRVPEKRAMLVEISAHPWLATNKEEPLDMLPLVSREQLSEDDHNLIVQKIVNGNIATKEEIQECLDKNEYNHITATYFLLAERKLRSKRQEFVNKGKQRPDNLAVTKNCPIPPTNNAKNPNPTLLSVPRTPGDVPQRIRKCSIVQEDEEEEDISSCSGREELSAPHNSLNRRGSRSEGRLNMALQERLADSERRKVVIDEKKPIKAMKLVSIQNLDTRPKTANTKTPQTTVITEPVIITIPVVELRDNQPKAAASLQLNEIFEEGDCNSGHFVSHRNHHHQSRTASYEQRRSKFHKNRTASCSSSDASDDDSENRKKRAHKLNASKALPGRRDSHDDSSDSQEPPGNGTAGVSGSNGCCSGGVVISQNNQQSGGGTGSKTGNGANEGRKHNLGNNTMLGRRHKASRRRNGETRLRESQSLNRITEVQEDGGVIISTNLTIQQNHALVPKVKGFGARILHFTMGGKRTSDEIKKDDKSTHSSRKDATKLEILNNKVEKENCKLIPEKSKKMRLLGKYFTVHRRMFIPIPGLFSRNKLYKAQSCSSLSRDKVVINREEVLKCRQRAASVIRNSLGSEDINQNQKLGIKSDKIVSNVCNGLTDMCIHLGHASKCSFC